MHQYGKRWDSCSHTCFDCEESLFGGGRSCNSEPTIFIRDEDSQLHGCSLHWWG
ncbi:unnamed protein product [Linum tenue]|uniref:Uncharacterized protein n=1 Tax=Linum tenue TaxID=586396 RepID=A0AAV0RJH6_9ROSI|nr:unnamed protein product [Linum tenue]